jgi:hypothetical protein
MVDEELGRLLRMSQGALTPNQERVLVSHFGIVASELVLKRSTALVMDDLLHKLRNWTDCTEHGHAAAEIKELMGWD